MYGGVEQVENTFEDVLYFVCNGNEKHIKGYWDDEYIAVPINLF